MLSNRINDPDTVLKLYAEGMGTSLIARKLRVKCHTVHKFLHDRGVMRSRLEGKHMQMMRHRKDKVCRE